MVSKIRYLGVIIDRNLNFAEHVDYIGREVGIKLGVLRRVGKDMTPCMRCIVYKSVVAPLFEYYVSILIGVDKTNLQYLQKLQNKAMRIILKCNRSVSIVDTLEALKFLSINERIKYNICLLIFKMINVSYPSYLRVKVNLVQYERALTARRGDKMYIEKCRTGEQQRMLLHNGFKIYNDLPCEVRRERNFKCFRRLLIHHIKRRERVCSGQGAKSEQE